MATRDTSESDFGILMASVNGRGTWAALKELRAALRDLSSDGSARVLFIDALDREGHAVNLQAPGIAAVVLGYALPQGSSAEGA